MKALNFIYMYIHVLFVSIISAPPHTHPLPSPQPPPHHHVNAYTHIMTYFKKNALTSQRTSWLCCSVLENLKSTKKTYSRSFVIVFFFFLRLKLKFRISFQKCPVLENHKWIDIYPSFLNLGKACLTTWKNSDCAPASPHFPQT